MEEKLPPFERQQFFTEEIHSENRDGHNRDGIGRDALLAELADVPGINSQICE